MTGRILVVDDIEANVRLLQAKLQAEYYDVLTASDGLSALAVAAAERPDLVLLDVMMPGMDGFEVCRRMKEDPATRHMPIVLVTAGNRLDWPHKRSDDKASRSWTRYIAGNPRGIITKRH